jgi:Tol biopolymer transport system component
MSELRDALERVELPGAEEARLRAWATLSASCGQRAPRRRARAPRVGLVALAALLLVAAVAVAAQRPRWVRHVLGEVATVRPRADLGPLPGGRLLISAGGGTWIVAADGTRTRLGSYGDATWSPRGLYVAAWRGRELSALTPAGRVVWTVAARGAVRDARWSPDGYRIAYRRGPALAVVAGDGTAARVFAAAVTPVAAAWRPGAPHTLAWVDARGHVEVADADSGRVSWGSHRTVGAVRELAWSADGHRLIARSARRVTVFDVRANRAWRVRLPRGARVTAAAWAPRGDRLALVTRTGATSRVDVVASPLVPRRPVFATMGTLDTAAWSPGGARLLVRWREADQWLLLRPGGGHGAITAIGGVARRFGGAPVVRGWCCVG